MPGFRISSSSKKNTNEIESQEVSGPLKEVLRRLSTTMEEEAKQRKENVKDLPAVDLTPSVTFEPSMASPPSPTTFHDAKEFMDTDGNDKDGSSASEPEAKPKTKLELAQDHLSEAREKVIKENPKLEDLITTPKSSGARSTAWDRQARSTFAPREELKAQLMRELYGDPTWTAQRLLEENGENHKADEEDFWDQF